MTEFDLQGVGARLRHLRKLNGMTQQQLAARTHFSTSLVKKVERGSVPASAASTVAAARALGIGLPYLYGVEDSELLERDDSVLELDNRLLYRRIRMNGCTDRLSYTHRRAREEPLLA